MNISFQRLIYHFKGYYSATILNILGIATALAVCSILAIQILYDTDYDNFYPDSDRIYTIGTINGNGDTLIVMSNSLMHNLMKDSKNVGIENWTFREPYNSSSSWKAGNKYFASKQIETNSDFPFFFGFKIIAGDIRNYKENGDAMVPKSIALANWGKIDIIGSKISDHNKVVAVYENMPENTLLKNIIYVIDTQDYYNPYYFSNQVFLKVASSTNIAKLQSILQKKLTLYNKELKKELAKRIKGPTDFIEDSLFLMPIHEVHFDKNMTDKENTPVSRSALYTLFALTLSILMIAVINFAIFNMALISKKRRSDTLRRVIGASRWQRAWLIIGESIGISFVAWIISVALFYLGCRFYIHNLITAPLDFWQNWIIMLLSLCIAMGISIIVSIYPIYHILKANSAQDIKRNFGLSRTGRSVRNILIGIQFLFSITISTCGVFMYMQEYFMLNFDGGFDKFHITNSYLKDTIKNADSIINSIEKIPGVDGATLSRFALGSEDDYMTISNETIKVNNFVVSSNYLDVMNIPIIEGRNFKIDKSDIFKNVIMNETARRLYPKEIQAGKYVTFDGEHYKIIGICKDFNYFSARSPIGAAMLMPYPNALLTCVTAKVNNPEDSIVKKAIKDVLDRGDAGYDHKVKTYREILPDTYRAEIKETMRIIWLSIISIILSLMGLCALIVMDNETRIKEYAIRRTFGASSRQIMTLAISRYLKIMIPTFILSLPISWHFVNDWLNKFAAHISNSWIIYLCIFIVTLLITIIWIIIFTMAYLRTTPSHTLRWE